MDDVKETLFSFIMTFQHSQDAALDKPHHRPVVLIIRVLL